jgi:adenylylsulfate kinase
MMDAGVIVLTAFISPFIKDRNIVRELSAEGEFIEVYCDASLDVCESRDVKGLYKKVRAGEITNFTGISSPYEQPSNPEIILDTANQTIEKAVECIITYLSERQIITINHS